MRFIESAVSKTLTNCLLHDHITKLNPGLRISPNREFFEMLPWDAYDMLFAIAQMHNGTNKLKRNDANLSGQDDPNDSEYSVDALFPSNSEVRSLYDRIKHLILSLDSSHEEAPRKTMWHSKGEEQYRLFVA